MPKYQSKPLPPLNESDIARFWKYVDKSPGQGPKGECWLWIGHQYSDGYGQMKIARRSVRATRVAFKIQKGFDPYPELVCHTCDTPLCCRNEHIFKGSHADNSADAKSKGRICAGDKQWQRAHPEKRMYGDRNGARTRPDRRARGERVNTAKLTESEVREIRKLYADGSRESQASVAARYGVTQTVISHILLRMTWKHLPD